MERKIEISVGEFYHIYSRGVEKRKIFLDVSDRERFLKLLYLANGDRPYVFRLIKGQPLNTVVVGEKKTAIGAFVLMPNHIHILLKETREGGISSFMEKLLTGYSMYFNKRYNRVGPLFQSRFKAEHAHRDEYLKYLFAYIHLNPIKLFQPKWRDEGIKDARRAKKFLEQYTYSSYPEYVGDERPESIILSKKEFPEYFSEQDSFEDFLRDWIEFREEEPARER